MVLFLYYFALQGGTEKTGWSNFNEVFMVSALHGSGVGDIKVYNLVNQDSRLLYSL
jgi:hypothetical protein